MVYLITVFDHTVPTFNHMFIHIANGRKSITSEQIIVVVFELQDVSVSKMGIRHNPNIRHITRLSKKYLDRIRIIRSR